MRSPEFSKSTNKHHPMPPSGRGVWTFNEDGPHTGNNDFEEVKVVA